MRILYSCLVVLILISCGISRQSKEPDKGPIVILKLDDLWYEDGLVHPGWIQVIDFLNAEGVTGTIGLVGNSLEEDHPDYFDWINARHEEGYEIWHHGFCHCRHEEGGVEVREYRGESKDSQAQSIVQTQQLAEDKLGLTLHSFGAPYNSTDEFTAEVLAEVPDLKVWMYKETEYPTDKFVIERISEVNIEYPVHVPDFDQFRAGYEQYRSEPVLVIQGHPRSWVEDKERFHEFKRIVAFLKSEGVQFSTPYEYFLMQSD